MTGWTLLAFAIAAEVVGTTALRASNGLTRAVPVTVSTLAYVASFALLALTLKHLSLGMTYAIWSGKRLRSHSSGGSPTTS